MRFALQHGVGDPAWTPAVLAPAAVIGFARAAEEAGFGALGFTDHPAPSANWVRAGGEGSADPFTSLGFCAAVTSTIRLLTFVLVLPYRNPYAAAHAIATLDRLSAGRLTVGAGTGYLKSELRALGADPALRRQDFDQAWEVMTELWRGGEVTREDGRFPARGILLQPGVVQRPHPPLWVHGNSSFGRERAARHGQGWLAVLTDEHLATTMRTQPLRDLDDLARAIDDLRTRTQAAGRVPEDIEVVVAGIWPMLDVRNGWDADQRREQVAKLETMGVDWLAMLTCGDDPVAAEETVHRFGEDVVAHCR